MSKLQAPKGFEDVLPATSWKWQAVERIAREISELYHFHEIRTPVMEHSELFHRGVGETSDIVHKETFTFTDRGGDSMTLRPEGTAGVVRAMIEHNLLAQEGSRAKVFYIAPNFRYERPQKGRLRQHHQFGAEAFGLPDPEQDVECILLQMDFYRRCGIKDLELQINSLGDSESKQRYRDALVAFLKPTASHLSEDSQRRLETNPLRILDSKDPRDQQATQGAPPAHESLSEKSRRHFEKVHHLLQSQLEPKKGTGVISSPNPELQKKGSGPISDAPAPSALNPEPRLQKKGSGPISDAPTPSSLNPEPRTPNPPFKVNPNLVRGFDYYTETLWEVTAGGLGAQNALGGGGRYDNLVENLGGRPTPGVGFGSGLERLLIALDAQGAELPRPTKPLFWLIAHGDPARQSQFQLLRELRDNNIAADMDFSPRSLKAQFKVADREHANYSLIVGDAELQSNTVVLKDLANGQQSTLPRPNLIPHLRTLTPAP